MADILVVDDDQSVATALQRFFAYEGHDCRLASGAADGLSAIEQRRPDLVMMDIRMPGVDGLATLETVRAKFPGLCVVMMTGYGTSQTSIDAIRAGAFDYVTKPPDLDELRTVVERALAAAQTLESQPSTEEDAAPQIRLIGDTPAMQSLYKMIGRLAINDVPALIVGERGSGKSLIVATLHANSARRGGPLRVLDGDAADDLERELSAASHGTLHLANVERLPLPWQARLARGLTADAQHIGADDRIDTRVVASTTRDLAADVAAGTFSRELYDALGLITLTVPPLRDRRDDIPLLVRYFLQRLNSQLNRAIKRVDDQVAKRLQDYAWPGNVAELERVLKRAAIVAGTDVITSDEIGELSDTQFSLGADGVPALARAARTALHERLVESSDPGVSVYHDIVDVVETALVKEALTITNGNQVKASELLGVNRATLRKKAPADS